MNSVLNFRDAGGYKNCDGGKIKNLMLFRSGNLDEIKGDDIEKFLSLNIKTIIDLRQIDEHKKRPLAINDIDTLSIPINTTRKTREILRPYISKRREAKSEIILAISGIYEDMVEKQMVEVAKIFHHLAKSDSYPVLIHCHIGKDRTGFIIALLHLALGLDISVIKSDYLLSNEHLEYRTKRMLRMIRIFTLGSFPVGNFRFSSIALEEYISVVYQKIIDKFGGIGKYLNCCGVEDFEILKIREILLDSDNNRSQSVTTNIN